MVGSVDNRRAPLEGWKNGQTITNTAIFMYGLGQIFIRSTISTIDGLDLSPSTKAVDRAQARSGDTLTYMVHVRNASDLSHYVFMGDAFPAGLSYVPDSASATSGTIYTATDHLEWVGDLPYTTTYTNISGDYEWGDSLGRGVLPGVKYDWTETARLAFRWASIARPAASVIPCLYRLVSTFTAHTTQEGMGQ